TGDRSVSGASGSGGRRRGRQEGVPPVRREAVTYAWKDRQLRLSTARPHTARGPSARFVHLAVYTRTEPRQPAPHLRWARSGEVDVVMSLFNRLQTRSRLRLPPCRRAA